jgi:hypothetical protein
MIAAVIMPASGFLAIFGGPIAHSHCRGRLSCHGKRRGRYIWIVVIAA